MVAVIGRTLTTEICARPSRHWRSRSPLIYQIAHDDRSISLCFSMQSDRFRRLWPAATFRSPLCSASSDSPFQCDPAGDVTNQRFGGSGDPTPLVCKWLPPCRSRGGCWAVEGGRWKSESVVGNRAADATPVVDVRLTRWLPEVVGAGAVEHCSPTACSPSILLSYPTTAWSTLLAGPLDQLCVPVRGHAIRKIRSFPQ